MATHRAAVAAANKTLGPNPTRFLTVLFVKTFVIWQLLAYCFGDDAVVKSFFAAACVQAFPPSLFPSLVKKVIAELYSATMKLFTFRLTEARKGAGGPIVHANFELWTSKNSNERYIGEARLTRRLFGPCDLDVVTYKSVHFHIRGVLSVLNVSTARRFSP